MPITRFVIDASKTGIKRKLGSARVLDKYSREITTARVVC